jgi:hypothetical protein
MAFLLCLILFGEVSFAQSSGSGSGSGSGSNYSPPPRKKYSVADFLNYIASFSTVPSTYTWDKVPTQPSTPGRSAPSGEPPIPLEPAGVPGADIPACLKTYTSPDQLYSGTCSSTSGVMPYVKPDALGYEGTYCGGAYGLFNIQAKSGGALKDFTVFLDPAANIQWAFDTVRGTKSAQCSALTPVPGAAAFNPDYLRGSVTFNCLAGVWRLVEVTCTDQPDFCGPGTMVLPYSGGYTASVSFPGKGTINAAGPSFVCSSVMSSAGAGYHWIGNVQTTCKSDSSWGIAGGSNCAREADPPPPPPDPNLYPNCRGVSDGSTVSAIKEGLDMCLTADGAGYYWYKEASGAITACATPATGCY